MDLAYYDMDLAYLLLIILKIIIILKAWVYRHALLQGLK